MRILSEEQKRARIFQYVMLVFLSIVFLMYFWGLFTYIPGRFYRQLLPMVIWGMMGIAAYKGAYGKWSVYTLGIGFLVWYYITRCLNGDAFLNFSYTWLIEFCLVYGVVFPFARMTGDGERRAAFDIAALVCVITLLIMAVPGVISAVTGEVIEFPLLGVDTAMRNGRLKAMSQISNGVCVLMNIGLFLSCYLLAAHWKRWSIVPGVLLILIFFTAGSLTVSRGGLAGRAVTIGVVACLFAGRIPLKKHWLRAALLVVVLVVGSVIGYKLSDVSVGVVSGLHRIVAGEEASLETTEAAPEDELLADEDVLEEASAAGEADGTESVARERKVSDGLGTLNGRLNILKEFFAGLRSRPEVLWKGIIDNDVMLLTEHYQRFHYLHNSFLQVLAQTGIPGLLIALVFCVLFFLSALKIMLDKTKTMGQKMLPVLMVPLVVHGLLESFLFVTWRPMTTSSFVNLWFFLAAGYTMEMAKGIRFKQLLSRWKEN